MFQYELRISYVVFVRTKTEQDAVDLVSDQIEVPDTNSGRIRYKEDSFAVDVWDEVELEEREEQEKEYDPENEEGNWERLEG